MNARWFLNHLVGLIAGAVFVVLLAVILWLYSAARTQQAVVLNDLQAQQSQLQMLHDAKIFPSKKNIEQLKRDRDSVQQLYEAMRGAATHPLMHGRPLARDIDFSQFMRETVSRLSAAAAEQHVRVPEGFAFGFSRYDAKFPCRNPVANGEECARLLALLSKQLVAVEQLANLLISNRVEEITAIQRTEVEPGELSGDALNLSIQAEPNALYQTYPFELRFSCDTPVLRNFLNSLMQADGLFIVRALKVETAAVQLKATDAAAATSETEPMGARRKRRLNVTLQIDLIEFTPTGKPNAGRG